MSMMDGFLDYMENTTPGQRLAEGREFAGRQRMVADAILAERTAAMFRRRYPGTRPESLDFVIGELGSFAASMRRKAADRA